MRISELLYFRYLLIVLLISSCEKNIADPQNQPPIFDKSSQIFLIGDSTCSDFSEELYPLTGWGTKFKELFEETRVVNHAISGRSSKSFYHEVEAWTKTKNEIQEGDFVLIQFGHNDQKRDTLRNTLPFSTYQEYLLKFISEIDEIKAFPILLTSINRNSWENGKITNSLSSYPVAMRELANQENIPLIDLNSLTKENFESLGEDFTTYNIFMNLNAKEYENYPNGKTDNSHLQDYGALFIANLAFEEIQLLSQEYEILDNLFN